MKTLPSILLIAGISFGLGCLCGREPFLGPPDGRWDVPLSGRQIHRLPPLDAFQAHLRSSGAIPQGYALRRLEQDQLLPPLGPRQIPQLYTIEDGGVLKAARVTIDARDFLAMVGKIPAPEE